MLISDYLSFIICIWYYDLTHFRELCLKIFSFAFDSNENFKICFQDLPTFSSYDFPGEVVQMTSLVRPFAKG